MLKVIKRDGSRVDFDISKINRAVLNAMSDTIKGVDEELANTITKKIEKLIYKRIDDEEINIEDIQNYVEVALMDSSRHDVAKQYIIYRYNKDRERRYKNNKRSDQNELLTDEFLSKYKHAENKMSQLGNFVYYRTYSRWLPKEGRREYWWETVRRAVEYNCNLMKTSREEAEKLYDNIFNLRQFLSGRTMWIGNTEISRYYPMANYNCAFEVVDNLDAFSEIFYLLMLGAGVGARILLSDIEQMQKIRRVLKLNTDTLHPIDGKDRIDNTSLEFLSVDSVRIIIGDSKEGWVQALRYYFEILHSGEYRNIKNIWINYDNVRKRGERLKTFGGTASGHESLKQMFMSINKVIERASKSSVNEENFRLRTIDCLDILNIIGENVVSGGVRRTAEMIIIDPKDKECLEAKKELYKQEDGIWKLNELIAHRQLSNNSIMYSRKPIREDWHKHIVQMRNSGEPGWINEEFGKKRRPNFKGVNPCFTGDMRLLTEKYGYLSFREIVDVHKGRIDIISKNGKVSVGSKVWSNGVKKVIALTISNGEVIKCTPDHRFMRADNGEEIEAKDTLDIRIKSFSALPLKAGDEIIDYIYNPTVIKIEEIGEEEVFDFAENTCHWGVVEGLIAHNCGEILLDSKELCNLTTVNVMSFVKEGKLDTESLLETQRISARAGYRMTTLELEKHDWNKVSQRDKLIGCSLTGWQDMVNATKMSREEEIELLTKLRETAKKAAKELADSIGAKEPILATTIKPEGTLSLLPTVSSGVHYSHAPYYIRRVRISADDPLVKVCEELGYPVYPEVGQSEDSCVTKVVEFPVKAADGMEGKYKKDVTAIEQLENYKLFMSYYVDHNCSITVHVRDNEWEDVEEWVWNNWDECMGISFLPYDDNFYELLPFEEITEEEYKRRASAMPKFIPSLISKYEKEELELDIGDDACCSNGVCPVR